MNIARQTCGFLGRWFRKGGAGRVVCSCSGEALAEGRCGQRTEDIGPGGKRHVRPHPGPLPQERGNIPPTHNKSTIPVAGWFQVHGQGGSLSVFPQCLCQGQADAGSGDPAYKAALALRSLSNASGRRPSLARLKENHLSPAMSLPRCGAERVPGAAVAPNSDERGIETRRDSYKIEIAGDGSSRFGKSMSCKLGTESGLFYGRRAV